MQNKIMLLMETSICICHFKKKTTWYDDHWDVIALLNLQQARKAASLPISRKDPCPRRVGCYFEWRWRWSKSNGSDDWICGTPTKTTCSKLYIFFRLNINESQVLIISSLGHSSKCYLCSYFRGKESCVFPVFSEQRFCTKSKLLQASLSFVRTMRSCVLANLGSHCNGLLV